MAALRRPTSREETRRAPGWTLKTTALPPDSMPMELLVMVASGLVTGVMAPMTPYGARSTRVRPCSSENAEGPTSSTPGVFMAASSFLIFLSRTFPRPVSATASAESDSFASRTAGPHGADDAAPGVQRQHDERTLCGRCRRDRAVDVGIHAGAVGGAGAGRGPRRVALAALQERLHLGTPQDALDDAPDLVRHATPCRARRRPGQRRRPRTR